MYSRPKEEVQDIASKGGKSSGGGQNNGGGSDPSGTNSNSHTGKQGFASMDADKQVCVFIVPDCSNKANTMYSAKLRPKEASHLSLRCKCLMVENCLAITL